MKKAFRKAGAQLLVAFAIEFGEKVGKAAGNRLGRVIEGKKRKKGKCAKEGTTTDTRTAPR